MYILPETQSLALTVACISNGPYFFLSAQIDYHSKNLKMSLSLFITATKFFFKKILTAYPKSVLIDLFFNLIFSYHCTFMPILLLMVRRTLTSSKKENLIYVFFYFCKKSVFENRNCVRDL